MSYIEEFFKSSLLGIVPILELMDDYRVVDTLIKMFGEDDNIRIHLEKFYTHTKIFYRKNGNIKHQVSLLNGLKHGLEIFYYEDGAIKNKTLWVYGKRHLTVICYNKNGTIRLRQYYCHGNLIKDNND